MESNQFQFVSHWRVPGTIEEVAAVLKDAADYPHWWPSVFLESERGADDLVSVQTRGLLPCTLRWELCARPSLEPATIAFDAHGDLQGTGTWTMVEKGPCVELTFDWSVRFNKTYLSALSSVLRPVYEANHRWAMRQGEASLRLELARRRAITETEADLIAQPPQPQDDRKFWLGAAAATLLLLVTGKRLRGRKRRR